ncbi:MAG: hypothetical protein AB7O97_03030 [Planctomycetota bacterium]
MKIPALQASLPTLLVCALASAQGDTVTMANGTVVDGASVKSYTVRELKYTKGGKSETVAGDQVAGIDLERYRDVYKRSIANRDAALMLTESRNQLEKQKDELMAQVGYVECAKLFYSAGDASSGGQVLEELQQKLPDAGLIPETYRLKFDSYMGRGDASGYQNAGIVAKKYATEATTNAWPMGFMLEGEFFVAVADQAAGGDAQQFQTKMRDVASRAGSTYPNLAARANVQLGHSLRLNGNLDGARQLYQGVLDNKAASDETRAGAWLGLGHLAMARGDAANRDPYREALLAFLRVKVETRNSSESLQAEALYNGMLAAEKWGGEDFRLIQGRCRYLLLNNYANSEWAARARGQ